MTSILNSLYQKLQSNSETELYRLNYVNKNRFGCVVIENAFTL